MPTRREFLGVSTGAVAALAVPVHPVPPAEAQAGCGALPPSIQALTSQTVRARPIPVEEAVRWVFSSGAHAAMPAAELASGTPVTAGCRMVKSPHEIELMRLAAEITWTAYEAAWKALADGMTQDEFARLVSAAHEKLG